MRCAPFMILDARVPGTAKEEEQDEHQFIC
jgi:hypothetical protein